jgi:hypothetical protein
VKYDKTPNKMRRPLLIIPIVIFMAFSVNGLFAQAFIDMALYVTNSPDCDRLEVRLRATQNVDNQNYSAGVFTVRFPTALGGTLSTVSSPYGYAFANLSAIDQGGFDYYAFQFVQSNFVTWTAGVEYVAAVLEYSGGPATGGFELITGDAWTSANNANFYQELGGAERQGIYYHPNVNNPDIPTLSASPATICGAGSSTLSIISGSLGDATDWHWYSGSCGGTFIGTGTSIVVAPVATTTYYVRGEGGCLTLGGCAEVTVNVGAAAVCTVDGPLSLCPNAMGNVYSAAMGMSSYSWSITGNGSIVGPANGQTVTVDAGAAGSFTLSVTIDQGNNCVADCDLTVMVEDLILPSITCPDDFSLYPGDGCEAILPDLTQAGSIELANSITGFSGTQGGNNWFYGKYAAFDTPGFTQLPNYTGSIWNNPGVGAILDFPQIDANGGHPQFEGLVWAVRRWVSNYTGTVTISGDFFDRDLNCGDGANVRIFKNGAQVYDFLDIPGTSENYSFSLAVQAGDFIDFAIDPIFDASCDDTHFTAVISIPSTLAVSDNCGVASVTQSPVAGTVLPVGNHTVTLTATDLYGNENSCDVTVTVEDSQAPVISTCPVTRNIDGCSTDDITGPVYSTTSAASSYTEFSNATNQGAATDNCGITAVTYIDVASGNCPIVVTRTWTLSDGVNTTSCEQTINVIDNEPPVIATTAVSGDLGCSPTVAAPEFTATDNCSGDLSSSIIVTTDGPMNTGCAYTQTWTANVSDACGNAADPVSITYTWTVDTEKPVIATTAMSGNLGCNPTVAAPEFTGTDNCGGRGVTGGFTERLNAAELRYGHRDDGYEHANPTSRRRSDDLTTGRAT